jgi:hypothetical protein
VNGTSSIWLFGITVCFWGIICCTSGERQQDHFEKDADPGETLARKYCTSCHLFPEPGLLDKNTWTDHALPAMAHRFGIYTDRSRDSLLEKGIARRIVEQANVFPVVQTISDDEWELIKEFYRTRASNQLANIADTIPVEHSSHFQAQVPKFSISHPAVTAFAYDENKRQLYVADCSRENQSSITILDDLFKPITSLGLPHPVSNLTLRDDTLYILSMGHFVPSDEPVGQLIRAIKNSKGDYEGYQRLIKNLKRPVDVAYGDLNGDGIDEIVVCEFGNHTGSVSLFVKNSKGSFDKKILLEAPGAIKVVLEDIDDDKRKDVVVLMSQGDEGIDVFFNRAEWEFERRRVLRFPAVYGSVSFCLIDINNDGYKDIIYVNGDNGDASRILKPYHGIRVFLSNARFSFVEEYFFPLHGAYGALAEDFDRDGDIDIAAISFFSDFHRYPEKGFIYLETRSAIDRLIYSPSVIEGTADGRWITMIGGDFNSDGYEDLILGSFTSMHIMADSLNMVRDKLRHSAQPLLLLKNTSRN